MVRFDHLTASWPRLNNSRSSHFQSQFSSWPVACWGSQVTLPANFCPTHDVSDLAIADTRTHSGLTVSNRFVYSILSGGAFSHYRSAYHAVRLFLRGSLPLTPLTVPNLDGSYRLSSASRPWIDALSLLIMAISWLGKSGSLRYASTGADPSIALAAWTRLVIGLPCPMPNV